MAPVRGDAVWLTGYSNPITTTTTTDDTASFCHKYSLTLVS